jgi:NADH dehydrogenase FAD-containing subunit
LYSTKLVADMAFSSEEGGTILILGASYAGLSLTHYLLKHILPSLPNHRIILVSSSQNVMCRPACPRAMISDTFFNQSKLFVDVAAQLEQYSSHQWTFIHGVAVGVDHEARIARIKRSDNAMEEVIRFHALVIATGASTTSPLLSNGPERAASWASFRCVLKSARKIMIAGGGPTGVEIAGELGDYLNGRNGARRERVEIILVTSAERILPDLRPLITAKAEEYLFALGVTIVEGTKVVGVEAMDAGRRLSSLSTPSTVILSSGEELQTDMYIAATGTKPNTSFLSSDLVSPDRRVITNAQTLRVDIAGPQIYALGDCSDAFRPAIHNIMAAVPVLGANIGKDLLLASGSESAGSMDDKLFKADARETQLIPIGTRKGVGAAMGWRLPGWLVWLIKGRDYWLWTTSRLWSGKQW